MQTVLFRIWIRITDSISYHDNHYAKHISLYVYLRVDWKVHRQTKILSWNVTKWGLFFNIVTLEVHSPSFLWCCRTWIPFVRKSFTADMISSYELFNLPIYSTLIRPKVPEQRKIFYQSKKLRILWLGE